MWTLCRVSALGTRGQILSAPSGTPPDLSQPRGMVAVEFCIVRFGVFTALTMKNVVFWDIKTQFVHHRRHITSPL
jgi:hypothetical protein